MKKKYTNPRLECLSLTCAHLIMESPDPALSVGPGGGASGDPQAPLAPRRRVF